jgi:Zn-dependent protease
MHIPEIRDLLAAWLLLGVAFGNLVAEGMIAGADDILIALATVGIGFLLHELAHKVVAQRYGLVAEFRAEYRMLFFAVLMSVTGILFAAPGAVYTSGVRTTRQQVRISAAGPVTNILLALAFLPVGGAIGGYGFMINAWLALFNMIPFGGLDGQAIYRNDRPLYVVLVLVAAGLLYFL